MGRVERALIAMAAILSIGALAEQSGLRFNRSDSMPIGFWRIADPKRPLARGDVVIFCAPQPRTQARPNMGQCEWPLLLKPIVAVAGDEVLLESSGVSVNGSAIEGTARAHVEFEGAIATGRRVLRDGEFWVVANAHPRSFDSRYFGAIMGSEIKGVAKPVLLLSGTR